MIKKEEIILIGGGGHCKSCIDVIEMGNKYHVAGILDLPEKVGKKVLNYEIIATDNDIPQLAKRYKYFLVTVGHVRSPNVRIKLFNLIKAAGGVLPSIISPMAHVSNYSKIGQGTIVMHHALINVDARIGNNCIINSKALIEHCSKVGDHCHISTAATINGGVEVGSSTFVGSNAVSNGYIKIPENSFIKANSIIV